MTASGAGPAAGRRAVDGLLPAAAIVGANPNPGAGTCETNGRVSAVAYLGGTLCLGGSFTTVEGVTCNRLAACDAATGEPPVVEGQRQRRGPRPQGLPAGTQGVRGRGLLGGRGAARSRVAALSPEQRQRPWLEPVRERQRQCDHHLQRRLHRVRGRRLRLGRGPAGGTWPPSMPRAPTWPASSRASPTAPGTSPRCWPWTSHRRRHPLLRRRLPPPRPAATWAPGASPPPASSRNPAPTASSAPSGRHHQLPRRLRSSSSQWPPNQRPLE
jgi:hypothetical protein